VREDKEFREFRELVVRPDTFEEGFGWRTVVMALFVGFVMTPGQIYMSLVAGMEMGSAAQWVTVILYVEVARRAMKTLKRPEIFVLFYMSGAVLSSGMGTGNLLWQQFLVQSEEMRKMGVAEQIPAWFAPSDPAVLGARNFFDKAWLMPVGLMVLTLFITRLDHFGLGYIMFRLTSDVEELPFPMAPVQAMGMTALADASERKDTWRWRTFSIGGVAGAVFGFIYLGIPNITGAFFSESISVIPLPFKDLTPYTQNILPAMPMMLSLDLSFVVLGMVLPFWAMVGSFIGLLLAIVGNPLLYRAGVLKGWQPGLGGIATIQSNTMDFYLSFGLGLSLAVAVIGFVHVFLSARRKGREMTEAGKPAIVWGKLFRPPAGRGDISLWVAIGIYVFSTSLYVALSYWLVNYVTPPANHTRFPLWLLLFYGFVYTPVISYVSTRMEGIVGQQVAIPYVREATFILSGYKGAAIWFAPIPLQDYAQQAQFFKTTELTGTKFTSLIKSEMLIFPILAVGALLFSQFIWSLDHVPSQMFPYANQFWELRAYQQGLIYSSTLPGETASPFLRAFQPALVAAGFVIAVGVYSVLAYFGLPIFLVYGVVRGLDQSVPHAIVPMFVGALLGRFIFRRRFGENWPKLRIVFAAGFSAGMGLVAMLSLGLVFMNKSASRLPL
jgi:hypothetical protein